MLYATQILSCDNLSVRYVAGDIREIGLKEYVIKRLTGKYTVREFCAVEGVTFSINRGDMLGIIGTNGAGKSTLLKAISGVLTPSAGKLCCFGRIAALLELASGFDGDLTVAENTFLRGAMLGYTKKFMKKNFRRIIDFAELAEFEGCQFKHLSSGMKSRLAFSIASHLDPDILILDEVLSVGDGAFRVKSEAKMRSIINGGATTLLVSHHTSQIRSLCNKVLWLDRGKQIAFGDNVNRICDAYEDFLFTKKLPESI